MSCGRTGGRYDWTPEIQTLIVASMEIYIFLITTLFYGTSLVGTGGTYLIWKTSELSLGYFSSGILINLICGFKSTWCYYDILGYL